MVSFFLCTFIVAPFPKRKIINFSRPRLKLELSNSKNGPVPSNDTISTGIYIHFAYQSIVLTDQPPPVNVRSRNCRYFDVHLTCDPFENRGLAFDKRSGTQLSCHPLFSY